jgi:putative methylase
MVRSKRELAIFLSKLKVFEKPKVHLEQYPSDSNVAASLLWHLAMTNAELDELSVVDLGCGTGILGIGALVLGANFVEFIDVDPSVYPILKSNISFAEDYFDVSFDGKWSFSNCNIYNCDRSGDLSVNSKSIVLMNPPFGTKKKHVDKKFLQVALSFAPRVYSMHKTSTTSFIEAFSRTEGVSIVWREDLSFPIKNTMSGHKRKIQRIDVSIFYFERFIKNDD